MGEQVMNRVQRDLRLMFFAGLALDIVATGIGVGLLLLGYYYSPTATWPIWRFGRTMMVLGLGNLVVIVGMFVQSKKLEKHRNDPEESKQE
jgi:multisubunit Na+/H+ antiporter MnhB subunit